MLPPKQPLRSISAVRAPARAAPKAAARPPGPLPTTSTSVSKTTSTERAASTIVFILDQPSLVSRRRPPFVAQDAQNCVSGRAAGPGGGRVLERGVAIES